MLALSGLRGLIVIDEMQLLTDLFRTLPGAPRTTNCPDSARMKSASHSCRNVGSVAGFRGRSS